MTRLFLLILIIPSLLLGQTKDELDLCMAIQGNNFSTNTAAENSLNRILNTIGASKNFVLSPCDKINNAVATAYKGTRYILYDKEFMDLINRNTNDWSNLFVLAHEVGHHINGHSIDILLYANDVVDAPSLEKKRKQELEADEFAAFVLSKLGATLSQLNNVITLISDNSDDTYSTHPKRDKRLASVRVGFNKGYVKPLNTNTSKNNSTKNTKKVSNVYYEWEREEFSPLEYFKEGLESKYLKDPFFMKNAENVHPSKVIWSKVKGRNIDPDWNPNYSAEFLVSKKRTKGKRYKIGSDWYVKGNYPFYKFEFRLKYPDVDIVKYANSNKKLYDEIISETPFYDEIKASIIIDNKLYLNDFKFDITLASNFDTIKDRRRQRSGFDTRRKYERIIEIQDFCISIFKSSDTYDFNNYKIDLNFISALKNGKKLYIELNPVTDKGLRIFNSSQVFEFSLSGSSKALAD